MNHLLCSLVLWPLCLVATGADSKVDPASLKTFSAIGKERPDLNGYKEAELLRHDGKGCLTHMWFGGDWPGYDKTVLRVYVDGEERPSITMELGLGHGVGFGDNAAPWGSEKMGKTGHPSGLYNTYKIPFGKSIRVTAQRAKDSPDGAPFWWIIRGTENLPVTLAGVRLPETARPVAFEQRFIYRQIPAGTVLDEESQIGRVVKKFSQHLSRQGQVAGRQSGAQGSNCADFHVFQLKCAKTGPETILEWT